MIFSVSKFKTTRGGILKASNITIRIVLFLFEKCKSFGKNACTPYEKEAWKGNKCIFWKI